MTDGGNWNPQDGVSSSGAAAPGWYYADGDPAGTVRQWDGAQWVGGPTVPQGQTGGQFAATGPRHSSQPFEAWLNGWKKWNDFSGRARRAEYWWFAIINTFISIPLQILSSEVSGVFGILYLIFAVAGIIPGLAVAIRRMHDTGHSGWWIIVPIVNFIFAVSDSHKAPNKYGPSPKY